MPQPLRLIPICWRPSCKFVHGIGRGTTRDSLLMKEWLEADRGMRERCQSCVLPSPYLRHRAPGFEMWRPRLVCLVMPWIKSCNRHREDAFADCVPSRRFKRRPSLLDRLASWRVAGCSRQDTGHLLYRAKKVFLGVDKALIWERVWRLSLVDRRHFWLA